jgi:hypothetical protein
MFNKLRRKFMSKSKKTNSNEAADQEVQKPSAMSDSDRASLNDKARYDYGITNASDMQEDQLKEEMAAIDKQKTDAEKADAKSE